MRILLWHGYLLRGSGSNIYTASLAKSWRAAGHDVLLLCQERLAADFTFVDEAGDFDQANRRLVLHPTDVARGSGRCRVARPDIGGLLPVYVYDDYEGFTVKRFVDLPDDELTAYTEANITALVTAITEHEPDVIVTGHEVMGPYIALQACRQTERTYTAKLHGSALEYAVKLQDRYLRFAREGLCGADHVVGGSRYMIKEAAKVVPGWEEKASVVNPGCDTDLFRIREGAWIEGRVGYVGKLMAAKGVHDLLASLGLTERVKEAMVVGYGGFEDGLRALADALQHGARQEARALAATGEGEGPLQGVTDLFDRVVDNDEYWRRVAEVSIEFTGRLEHEPLAEVLPTLDVLVVPSVVPEAFGMVAAEAAACGVLPVVPSHSGIGEVGATLEDELGRPGLLTFDPADPIRGIAARIDEVIGLPFEERRRMGLAAAAVAHRLWSWPVVSERLLAVARS